MTAAETVLALISASTKESTIKPKKKNIAGRFVDDLKGLVTSIPKLPGALVQEARALPQAPGQVAEALARGDIREAFRAPGVRMLPGAFVASEGPGAFLEHPLFAALDVAPLTKFGISALPEGVRAAVKSPLAKQLDRFGMGPVSRETARSIYQQNRRLSRAFTEHASEVAKIQKAANLTDQRVGELTQIIQRGNPEELARLSTSERNAISGVTEMNAQLGGRLQEMGLLTEFDNELYPTREGLRLQRMRERYWKQVAKGNDAKANQILKDFQKFERKNPPARFRPALDQIFQDRLTALASSRNPEAVGAAWQTIQESISERMYDLVPNVTGKDLARLAKEITPTWLRLREEGVNPIFVHSVGTEQVGHLRTPRVFPSSIARPTSVRSRTWNMKPSIENFSVGLNHQGLEVLQRTMTDEVINHFAGTYGKTRKQLVEEYLPLARKYEAEGLGLSGKLESLISREYTKWDPTSIAPWRKARVGAGITPDEPIYLPKAVEGTIRRMYPIDRSQMARLWDSTMSVFRVGVLPLSPRWHIYNAIGGGAMLGARTGPGVVKYFKPALQMVREGTIPDEISRGMVSVPAEVRAWQFQAGKEIGRIFKNTTLRRTTEPVRRVGGQVIQKAFDIGEFADSLYRSMAYLYGKDKAVVKGLSKEAAESAGVKLANKILQDWDAMTPIERQVIRSIFPFYGWMKHILEYTTTYPWDHPYRASIVANFARNEIEDWETGLPEQFQNYFFIGEADEFGNQLGVNLRGANPFADVGNYFTLAGFLSQLNPVFQGVMEAMGLNPATGSADLYPNLVYNEETGRLQAATQNPVTTIIQGFVPQAAGITSLLGLDNTELKMLKLNNPDAYKQRIWTSFGIPFRPREVNRGLEAARSELRRKEAMQRTLTDALKSGDWSEAERYPQLRPILDLFRQLDERGALDQYRTRPAGEGAFDAETLLESIRGG